MKIHYAGQIGGPFGWGVFGQEMAKQFKAMGVLAEKPAAADVVLTPMAPDFSPAFSKARTFPRVFGMTFFEFPLPDSCVDNAKLYDRIFVGSQWCKDRCAEKGIFNTEVLIQGVDREIFKPGWNNHEPFRIFTGGKFEYRKGQDLVIAAFRELAEAHPEAHLVCAWHNCWPNLINGMAHSPVLRFGTPKTHESQEAFYADLLRVNGLNDSQFTVLPQLSQHDLAREMANTDCGLFPNRCEGGTNMVMMEYAACGGRVVANWLTGHRDVALLIDDLIHADEDANRWAVSTVDQVRAGLESAYSSPRRDAPRQNLIPTWEDAATLVLTQ